MGQPTDERGLGSRNSLRQDLTVSSPFMKILRGGKHFPFEVLMGCPYNLTARLFRDNSLGIICGKDRWIDIPHYGSLFKGLIILSAILEKAKDFSPLRADKTNPGSLHWSELRSTPLFKTLNFPRKCSLLGSN